MNTFSRTSIVVLPIMLAAVTLPKAADAQNANMMCYSQIYNAWQPCSSANPLATLPQSSGGGSETVVTAPLAAPTIDGSSTITTSGIFQTVLNANIARKSFEISNICSVSGACLAPTDNCYWTTVASGSATKLNSHLLQPGTSYLRSGGTIPSDAIAMTCDGTGDHFVLSSQ